MIEIRDFDNLSSQEVNFVKEVYKTSFPESERRPFDLMLQLYIESTSFVIQVVKRDSVLVGLLTYWNFKDFIFAEHFAIISRVRNGGIGKDVMDLFIQNTDKPIVLEVELPTTILAERRIGFYQRIGFKLWENIQYQQPAYREGRPPIPMKLMTYRDLDLDKEVGEIKEIIYREVYNC